MIRNLSDVVPGFPVDNRNNGCSHFLVLSAGLSRRALAPRRGFDCLPDGHRRLREGVGEVCVFSGFLEAKERQACRKSVIYTVRRCGIFTQMENHNSGNQESVNERKGNSVW